MAEANPTLVGTKIGHGDATKMGANGRAHEDLSVDGVGERGDGDLIEEGIVGERVGILDLRESETTDEDEFSVPRGLERFTRGKLRDIKLLVGVTDVSSSRDHLLVEAGDDGLHTEHVATDDETLQHVDLSSLDFIILVLLVPKSILIIGRPPPFANATGSVG